MFHVAAGTICLTGSILVGTAVEAGARLHATLDFAVTLQAFESTAADSEIVTRSAASHSVQLPVRARQGPR